MKYCCMKAAAQSSKFPEIPEMDRANIYKDAFESARKKLDSSDKDNIERILGKIDKKSMATKIKGLGRLGMLELIGSVGIMLAELPDKQFERMLIQRRNRV